MIIRVKLGGYPTRNGRAASFNRTGDEMSELHKTFLSVSR
jgi:hypothetical protein